jgi:hypothetical protein
MAQQYTHSTPSYFITHDNTQGFEQPTNVLGQARNYLPIDQLRHTSITLAAESYQNYVLYVYVQRTL